MVFSCLNCNARYRIDEKRLEGKVLKFTCRKCDQVHLLRDPAKGGDTVTAITATGSQPAIKGEPRRSTTARQAAMTTAARPTVSMPTVGRGSAPSRKVTTQTGALPSIPTDRTAAQAAADRRKDTWFAIRKGRRVGPLTSDKIGALLRDGRLHERSFVWRPTMPAWTRMVQVPELSQVVSEFNDWKASQYDRTVVQPPPKSDTPTPVSNASMGTPPPVPPDASDPSFAGAPRSTAPAGSDMVDSLYSGISRPAIDIRKAHEVQPEEPEIPDADQPPPLPPPPVAPPPVAPPPEAAPTPPAAPEASPAPESPPASEDSYPPPMAPAEPPQPTGPPEPSDVGYPTDTSQPLAKDEDLFPTSAEAPSDSQQFFRDKAEVLPAREWPTAPDPEAPPSGTGAQAITFGEAAAAHVAPPVAGERPPDTRLEDFSVMVRLSRKGRQHKVVVLGTLGVLLTAGIGIVLYLALTSDPADLGIGQRAQGEIPAFKQKLYTVIRPAEDEAVEPAVVPVNQGKRKTFSGKPRKPASIAITPESAITAEPPPPKLAKLGKLDPNAQADFNRYSGLLKKNGTGKRGETTVDVKPKTMTEMPTRHSLDKNGMDAFLATKMRKFSDCKRRMTRKTDMPVKVGLAFSIGLDGRAGGIKVDQAGGTRDEGLETCIRRVVGGWAFPPPDERTTFKTTLLL